MLKRLLLIFMILGLSVNTLNANDTFSDPPIVVEEEGGSNNTTAFGVLDIPDEDLRDIAENIFNLTKSISDEFYVSDGLTLAAYILRYMAEIGEYEIAYKDIMALVKAFENIQGERYDENIYIILEQIRKLKFGTRNGKLFVKFYSKKKKGITYDINELNDEPGSSLREIKFVTIKDGAEMFFDEVDSKHEELELIKWVKTKYRITTFGKYMLHEDISNFIESYFDLQTPAKAMRVTYKGFQVRVGTDTIFKDMDLKFSDGYVLPSFRKGEKPIPSFLLRMSSGLVKVKISIDQ